MKHKFYRYAIELWPLNTEKFRIAKIAINTQMFYE